MFFAGRDISVKNKTVVCIVWALALQGHSQKLKPQRIQKPGCSPFWWKIVPAKISNYTVYSALATRPQGKDEATQ